MAGDYNHGEMNINEQVSTFHQVMGMTKWGSLAIASAVFTLVLWFCVPTGFLTAVACGVTLLALGIFLLREKKTAPAH